MEIIDEKLYVTEQDLLQLAKANIQASPTVAGMFLFNEYKNTLTEEQLKERDLSYYTKAVTLYRNKNYEVKKAD